MFLNHTLVIRALLICFVGNTYGCYSSGAKFEEVAEGGDVTDAIITFCDQHKDQNFTFNDQV